MAIGTNRYDMYENSHEENVIIRFTLIISERLSPIFSQLIVDPQSDSYPDLENDETVASGDYLLISVTLIMSEAVCFLPLI